MYSSIISLNLSHDIIPEISVPQYDTGRIFNFYIENYNIPEDAEVYFYLEKPSGHEVLLACKHIENLILREATIQMFAEIGTSNGWLQIKQNGTFVTSFQFVINVVENPFATITVESTDEYNLLQDLISQTSGILEAEKERVSNEEERQSAELVRTQAEESRDSAEVLRNDNEIMRESNESSRKIAEIERENWYADKKVELENLITTTTKAENDANSAASAANNAKTNIESYAQSLKQQVESGEFNGSDGINGISIITALLDLNTNDMITTSDISPDHIPYIGETGTVMDASGKIYTYTHDSDWLQIGELVSDLKSGIDASDISYTKQGSTMSSDLKTVLDNQSKIYTAAVSLVLDGAEFGYNTMYLSRSGNTVHCEFYVIGRMATANQFTPVLCTIPDGYKSCGDKSEYVYYYGMSASAFQNNCIGIWKIDSSGNVYGMTNDASSYVERIASLSWITADDYPIT